MTRIEGVGSQHELPELKGGKSKTGPAGGFDEVLKGIVHKAPNTSLETPPVANLSPENNPLLDKLRGIEGSLSNFKGEIENFKTAINAYKRGQDGGIGR